LRAALLLFVGLAGLAAAAFAASPLQSLQVPPGFHVSICSDRVPNAREMALGTHDSGFVGSLREGKVHALTGMGNGHSCSGSAQPALRLGARVAALGIRLCAGRMLSEACHDAIFIAEHGSWNRSSKAGYRVVVVHVGKDGKVSGSRPFLASCPDGQETLGSLLVSDDDNGVIHRITCSQPAR
jgi:hypothetical protein